MKSPLPYDPFGRTRQPATFDREGRVQLIAAAAEALIDGREVPREAAMFLGSALQAWLQQGGPIGALERDHLGVTGPRRSTMTPARLWARMQSSAEGSRARATSAPDFDTMPLINTESSDGDESDEGSGVHPLCEGDGDRTR